MFFHFFVLDTVGLAGVLRLALVGIGLTPTPAINLTAATPMMSQSQPKVGLVTWG